MINHISILLAGFSTFSALILLIAYLLFLPDMRKSKLGKAAASVLLLSLTALQLAHYAYFAQATALLEYRSYGAILMLIPSSFFFFGRVVLFPDVEYRKIDFLHFAPPLLGLVLPISLLPPLAFLFGTAYTFWFARLVFKLRDQRGRFKFEMFFFGMFALMALIALMLGLSLPYLDPGIFYVTYGNAISIAVLMIVAALIFFPALLSDILLITELAYAKSKLDGVNTDIKIDELEKLMLTEKLYQNEDLNLANLAEQLTLSSHQLSELINTRFGYGFPRYVREHRIREAKKLLVDEPTASVLSISMMTGFKSQSNFYTAFKEILGESPGNYRKRHI